MTNINKISINTYKKAYEILDHKAEYELSKYETYIVYQYAYSYFQNNNKNDDFLSFFKSQVAKKSYSRNTPNKVNSDHNRRYSHICGEVCCLIRLFEYNPEDEFLTKELERLLLEQRNYKKEYIEKEPICSDVNLGKELDDTILNIIRNSANGIYQRELQESLALHRSTMSRVKDRLEKTQAIVCYTNAKGNLLKINKLSS